jgi:hypothetical protein
MRVLSFAWKFPGISLSTWLREPEKDPMNVARRRLIRVKYA